MPVRSYTAGFGRHAALASVVVAMIGLGWEASAPAQTLPLDPPPFAPLRPDDSTRDVPQVTVAPGLKRIDVGDEVQVSFGGEVRQRVEHYSSELFGLGPVIDDTYDLSRILAFAELRLAGGPRLFVEVGANSAPGKRKPLQEPDRDDIDLHQAFLDLPIGAATVQIGRQEMPLGSARFVDVREGPNVRQTFDGLHVRAPLGAATLDLFGVKPTRDRSGVLDDKPATHETFAGAYLSAPLAGPRPGPLFELGPKPVLAIDAYYYWHRTGPDAGGYRRHTLGLRGWGVAGSWDYDVEGIWQLGRSLAGRVRAGGVSGKTGYTLIDAVWSPRLGLQADWFSGDRHPRDGRDNTTDPLFPRGGYFSEPGLQTFSNIIDVYPSVTLNPMRKLAVQGGVAFVWRATRADTVYIAPLVPVPGTAGVGGRYAGTSGVLQATWGATPNLTLAGSLVHMTAGSAITAAGGHSTTYVATWAQFRF